VDAHGTDDPRKRMSTNWLLTAAKLWRRWNDSGKAPQASQSALWGEISGLMAQSTYWAETVGSGVMPPLESMPITTFDDYADALSYAYEHDTTSPLNGEPIERWVKSSGTSRIKRFPWTESYMSRLYDAVTNTMPVVEFLARNRGRPGHHLTVHGKTPTESSPTGIVEGFGSAFGHTEPDIYPPQSNSDAESIRVWRPAYCLARDLHSIRTLSCEPLFVMLERFADDRAFYLRLISGEASTPDGWPTLEVAPERVAYLRRLLASDGPLALTELWPNLRLLQTWQASVCGEQARRITRNQPHVHLLDTAYNATEGAVSNPIDPSETGGPIFADGMLHEFLEPGAAASPGNVLKAWDLEEGKDYEVLLTTQMGLVRYRLGDLVQCTGFWHRVPKLAFKRRASAEVSLGTATFGEDQLAVALNSVQLPTHVRAAFAPSADGRALCLCTTAPIPQRTVDAVQAAVASGNDSYADTVTTAWTASLRHLVVPPAHPFWSSVRPRHDQAKPRVLSHSAAPEL